MQTTTCHQRSSESLYTICNVIHAQAKAENVTVTLDPSHSISFLILVFAVDSHPTSHGYGGIINTFYFVVRHYDEGISRVSPYGSLNTLQ